MSVSRWYAAAAVALLSVGPALAQDVIIAPEQETVIREYVHSRPLASISVPGVELNVGSVLPDTVVTERVEVPDVDYQYVIIDDRPVLVEPSTRRIIRVLD